MDPAAVAAVGMVGRRFPDRTVTIADYCSKDSVVSAVLCIAVGTDRSAEHIAPAADNFDTDTGRSGTAAAAAYRYSDLVHTASALARYCR